MIQISLDLGTRAVGVLYSLYSDSFPDFDQAGMERFAANNSDVVAQVGVESYNEKMSALARNILGFCRQYYDDPAREAAAFQFPMESLIIEMSTNVTMEFDQVIQMEDMEVVAYVVNSVVDGVFKTFGDVIDQSSQALLAAARSGDMKNIEAYKLVLDDIQNRLVPFFMSF